MEINPIAADLEQLIRGKDGRMIQIENDVQGIAADLRRIDSHFRLRWSERGEYFVVYWRPDGADEGDGYMVTTAKELDKRLVKRVEEIHHRVINDPAYNVAVEADKFDAEKKAHAEYEREQKMGEKHEKLRHALRKDLDLNKDTIILPRHYKRGQG